VTDLPTIVIEHSTPALPAADIEAAAAYARQEEFEATRAAYRSDFAAFQGRPAGAAERRPTPAAAERCRWREKQCLAAPCCDAARLVPVVAGRQQDYVIFGRCACRVSARLT
jgi:hypothetical protein